MKISLNSILSFSPPPDEYRKLMLNLNNEQRQSGEVEFNIISRLGGLELALACTQALPSFDLKWRRYAIWCAKRARHLMPNENSLMALETAVQYANGLVDATKLEAAYKAAEIAVALCSCNGNNPSEWSSKAAAATTLPAGCLAARGAATPAAIAIGLAAAHKAQRAVRTTHDELEDYCIANEAFDNARIRVIDEERLAQLEEFNKICSTLI